MYKMKPGLFIVETVKSLGQNQYFPLITFVVVVVVNRSYEILFSQLNDKWQTGKICKYWVQKTCKL